MTEVTLDMPEDLFRQIVNDVREKGTYYKIDTKLQVIEDPKTGKVAIRLWYFGLWTDLELKED